MHLVVPNLTEQDCVVLDSTAVSCSPLDETEMSRDVTDCTAVQCASLYQTRLLLTRMDLGHPRLKCTQVEGNEWNWTEKNRIEQDGTGPEVAGLTGRDGTGTDST